MDFSEPDFYPWQRKVFFTPLLHERKKAIFRYLSSLAAVLVFVTASYGATITYVRKETTDNFLGWGQTGFYFPQFDAAAVVGPKRTDDNMQFYLPSWLEFNFNPIDLNTTFSADKPNCFDDCRGRGVYTRGGYANWATFTLPNGFSGRSGSVVDEQAENNTNNTVNKILMKPGVPSSFCMHLVTDNTDNAHDSAQSIIVRGGRTGQDSFDPRVAIPDLSFNGRTDVHTFRFDDFIADDFIKIRLNSGTPGMAPGFGGLMFDLSCRDIPNRQCGNNVCELSLGESCESCPGDCGPCLPGKTPAGTWYHHGANSRPHYVEGASRLLLFAAHGVDAANHRVEGVKYGDKRMLPLTARSQTRDDTATVSVWYLKETDIDSANGTNFTVDWRNKPGDRSFESIFLTDVSQTASFGTVSEAGCNDCLAVACPREIIETGHVSLYAGTHERDGATFSPLNNYIEDADLAMGGNGRATVGHKDGLGKVEAAGTRFGREGAFSLVCFEVQDLPVTASDGNDDDDGDGLSNAEELALGTLPDDSDTDDDSLEDGAEVKRYGTNPRSADTDRDGLTDGQEVQGGTDPTEADSDNDGMRDGYELEQGLDPNDPSDCTEFICGGGHRGWRLKLLQ